MTPEQARKLLEGTTPGPWEHEGRQPYIDSENFVIRQVGKPGVRIRGAAYGDTANIDLIAAAPGMAAMIAGMRTEYKMEVRDQHGKWHHGGWTDDPARCFEPSFFGLKITACRLVRRYVISPQPLGEEQ